MPQLKNALVYALPLLAGTMIAACGAPAAPDAVLAVALGSSAQAQVGEASDIGLFYAFDDYNDESGQLANVKALHADLASSVQADGPRVFLSADMQKAADFRTRVLPGQAWGQGFQPVGELESDHTTALRDFLQWMEAGTRPQTHLSILTHGGASQGLLWDYGGDPNSPTHGHVTLQNVARAIAKGHTGGRLPELDFDACMMASIEVGEAIKGVAAVYTGSEDFGIQDSTPYGRIIADARAGRSPDGESYGRTLVDEIVQHGKWGDKGTRTCSAIRLDHRFDQLVGSVDRLSQSLIAAMRTEPLNVRSAIADTHTFYWMQQYTVEYGDFHQRDIVEFCEALERHCSDPHVRADALATAAAVPPVLVAFEKHPSETMANGLAIYLPPYVGSDIATYRGTSFGRHTHWADFLAALGAKPPSGH